MDWSANVSPERRKHPRITLKKILYINLDRGNGGIVLNLSDGGLAFHSVVPLVQHGAVRFWFSLSNDHRIEVSGELVWADQTKKTGGVRFTNLTDETRAQIRNLTGELSILNPAPSVRSTPFAPVAVPEQESSRAAVTEQKSEIKPQPAAIRERVADSEPVSSQEADMKAQGIGGDPASAVISSRSIPPAEGFPQRGYASPLGRTAAVDAPAPVHLNNSWAAPPLQNATPSVGRVLMVLIAVLLIVAAGVVFYSHAREVSAAMVQWRDRLEGSSRTAAQSSPQVSPLVSPQVPSQEPPQQDAASVPAVVPPPEAPATPETPAVGAEDSKTDKPTTDIPPATAISKVAKALPRPSTRSSRATPPPAPVEAQASTPPTEDDGEADLEIAQRYLDGTGQIRNSAAAAQFLWAAVAKGSPTAELTLADLYLKGDGVARSCEQARVLLQAASRQGDAEATQALTSLKGKRCR